MKKLLFLPIILLVLASCKKNAYEYPTPTTDKSTTTTTTNTDTKGQDTNPGQAHAISLSIPDQVTTVTSTNNTVNATYCEHVILLVNTASYQKAYAVHVKEDFSGSDLAGYNYTVVGRGGNSTFNWVDDNLNNVDKTIKDTVINNVAITKIDLARKFNFTHTFDGDAAAATAYNKLLLSSNQTVSFAASLTSADPTVVTFTGKATLVYTTESN